MAGSLILIANPGSASRKYALYEGKEQRASLHFELSDGEIVCALQQRDESYTIPVNITELEAAPAHVADLLRFHAGLGKDERIVYIGLRVVAPGAYFLEDRIIDEHFISQLKAAKLRVPLHASAALAEIRVLYRTFPQTTIVGVSDSVFHRTKPDYAWNYGLPLHDADQLDIKRFGYHGLSVASTVHELKEVDKLPPKLAVCHIGSGVSVTAVHGGKSFDTTMGYSPLEGTIMATRSGSLDPTAANALKQALGFDDAGLETYLTAQSGLLGLGGSADLRELLRRESEGDHRAHLALQTYIFCLQKAIGSMAASLGGLDALVFTGTVGERSAPIRQRIAQRLHYLDFLIDHQANDKKLIERIGTISRLAHSKPVYVVATDEAGEMVRRVWALSKSR